MHHHWSVQPRQIYASTLSRRERRWSRRRARLPLAVAAAAATAVLLVLTVVAAIAPALG